MAWLDRFVELWKKVVFKLLSQATAFDSSLSYWHHFTLYNHVQPNNVFWLQTKTNCGMEPKGGHNIRLLNPPLSVVIWNK